MAGRTVRLAVDGELGETDCAGAEYMVSSADGACAVTRAWHTLEGKCTVESATGSQATLAIDSSAFLAPGREAGTCGIRMRMHARNRVRIASPELKFAIDRAPIPAVTASLD